MKRPGIKAYPELEKFIQLYWSQNEPDFLDALKLFRDHALSTPETRHMFKRLMEQMRLVEAEGHIREKMSHGAWVEFWGRNQRRIGPENFHRAMRALEEGTL